MLHVLIIVTSLFVTHRLNQNHIRYLAFIFLFISPPLPHRDDYTLMTMCSSLWPAKRMSTLCPQSLWSKVRQHAAKQLISSMRANKVACGRWGWWVRNFFKKLFLYVVVLVDGWVSCLITSLRIMPSFCQSAFILWLDFKKRPAFNLMDRVGGQMFKVSMLNFDQLLQMFWVVTMPLSLHMGRLQAAKPIQWR